MIRNLKTNKEAEQERLAGSYKRKTRGWKDD